MNSADLGKQGILDISVFEEGKSHLHSPDAKGVSIHAGTLWDLAAVPVPKAKIQVATLSPEGSKIPRPKALNYIFNSRH